MTEYTVKEIGHQWIVYVDGLSVAAMPRSFGLTHAKRQKRWAQKKWPRRRYHLRRRYGAPVISENISVLDLRLCGLRPATLGASTHIPNRMFSWLSLRQPRLATILSCRWQMPRSLRWIGG